MSTALLLADPELETRDELECRLADDGFDVLGAGGAREVLDLAERTRPDVVLLASGLADGGALDLCARLRSGERGRSWDRDVPVIMLGRNGASSDDRLRAFARGADEF